MDKVDRNVYCLIGDGESREGQIWEAMDFIADHQLTNCVPIFNANELAQSDYVSAQQSAETLAKKAEAFGFVSRTIDGHCPKRFAARSMSCRSFGTAIARWRSLPTIKGWGAASEQGTGKHGTPVKKDELPKVLAELDQTAKDLGVADVKGADELKIKAPAKSPEQPKGPIKIRPMRKAWPPLGFRQGFGSRQSNGPRQA